MPELPEVETVRATLAPLLEGRTVLSTWRSRLNLHRQPPRAALLERALARQPVLAVLRRGKLLSVRTPVGGVLCHLGMTGRLTVEPADAPVALHTHFRAALSDGHEWRLVDPRRFGMLHPFEGDPPADWSALGPDPTDPQAFTVEALRAALKRTRRAVKLALLDQAVVAGLGNIYVAEALHISRIHPLRPAHALRDREFAPLHGAIVDVIAQGIRNRGTSLSDYVDARGERGGNQFHLRVYGRAGEPCPVCESAVRVVTQGQRSTFFCATCQPRRPARA